MSKRASSSYSLSIFSSASMLDSEDEASSIEVLMVCTFDACRMEPLIDSVSDLSSLLSFLDG